MFYVYILQSLTDGRFYTGCSDDLKRRLAEHAKGAVASTKNRQPMKLVYYEACCDKRDAFHREKYLKTAWGKRYLKTRMNHYLTGQGEASTTEIAKKKDAQGFLLNKTAAQAGGNIAGNARKELEAKSGTAISTKENFKKLTEGEIKTLHRSKPKAH
jgi:putative endonuclease